MQQVLIVIDMQTGVFTLKRPVWCADALVANVRQAIRFARMNGIPVVFSLHENTSFLQRGTAGRQAIGGMDVQAGDIVVSKSQPDIFIGTDLDALLRERGITSLMIAGVISNGCVMRACQSALRKGYSVTLVEDAHSTFYGDAEKVVARVNREMESAGVRVIPVSRL